MMAERIGVGQNGGREKVWQTTSSESKPLTSEETWERQITGETMRLSLIAAEVFLEELVNSKT